MIEGMFGQSKLGSSNGTTAAPQQPSAEAASLLQGISSAATSAAPTTADPVQIANTAAAVDGFISTYKAVIVFFTSASCPPCRMIKPDFENLIREKNGDSEQIRILGVIMDTSMAPDAAKYGIRATPTFQLFLNGQKYSEFKGANYAELKSQVDILLFEAFPRKLLVNKRESVCYGLTKFLYISSSTQKDLTSSCGGSTQCTHLVLYTRKMGHDLRQIELVFGDTEYYFRCGSKERAGSVQGSFGEEGYRLQCWSMEAFGW